MNIHDGRLRPGTTNGYGVTPLRRCKGGRASQKFTANTIPTGGIALQSLNKFFVKGVSTPKAELGFHDGLLLRIRTATSWN